MNGNVTRNTSVVSVSLKPEIVRLLDETRRIANQTRSAFIATLIERSAQEVEWKKLRATGDQSATRLKLFSEDDVYRFLGDE